MKYYTIDPDVPGRFASETHFDSQKQPPDAIGYIFECWPDSDIVQSDPVFLVSDRLACELSEHALTGFELKSCIGQKGDQFHIARPGYGDLPKYWWLDVIGVSAEDDFGISEDLILTISGRALNLLREFNLERAEIIEI